MPLVDMLGMPVEQLFQGLLLPVLIIFAILWALLNSIAVFNRKINFVLAVALTIMAAMAPQFTIFTTYIAQLGAQIALVAFFAIFGVGAVAWALRGGRELYYKHVNPSRRIDHLYKKKRDYLDKAREAEARGEHGKAKDYRNRAREIDDSIQMLSE